MKRVYTLSSCDTCRRILKEVNAKECFEVVDIKKSNITEPELDDLYALAGSYEALFNKRARKIRELGLSIKTFEDDDFRRYLLEDYTFLKRPVFVLDDKIFIGNSPQNIEALKIELSKK